MLDELGGIVLPAASRAQRSIPAASKGHCTAHTVLGFGAGTRMQAESHLELDNLFLLNSMRAISDLQEQVRFEYGWYPSKLRVHVFDVVATFRSGLRIAYTVKPEHRLNSKDRRRKADGHRREEHTFLEKMGEIRWWAVEETQCFDDVRLITEADIDPISLHNSKIFAAVREDDPEADKVALQVMNTMPVGSVTTVRDLTMQTGLGARGNRAVLRLLRIGYLTTLQHEAISPTTLVVMKRKS